MAETKKESSTKQEKEPTRKDKKTRTLPLKDETKYGVLGIVFFVLALFSVLAAFDEAGIAGDAFYSGFQALFGIGYFLLPISLILLGYSFIRSEKPDVAITHIIGGIAFLMSSLGLVDIASNMHAGGIIGRITSYPFVKLFDIYASILILGAVLIISLLVLFDTKPKLIPFFIRLRDMLVAFFARFKKQKEEDITPEVLIPETIHEEIPEEVKEPAEEEKEESEGVMKKVKGALGIGDDEMPLVKNYARVSSEYTPPPLSLLEKDRGKANVGDIKANANIIKRTLLNFGIEVEMDEVTIGPTVTRYALKPAVGVKLSRIVGLQNDMAMALAAHPIRIEAPIPGKSLVGIEIPNKTKSTVGLGTLLSDPDFGNATKPLTVAVGRDIAGKAHFKNMAKMPHALIAGTTGSGKSVTIHAIIASLLYRNGPLDLKFIMVDPKRVELTLYNKIPHLLTPVITDAKKCIQALKWAAKEMDRRYDILQAESVRDIESYHDNIVKTHKPSKNDDSAPDPMPYIVIIIDELADIMQTYPRELEAAIVRLAQMSRAVGIHLILSTQRPEVNVITGLIKANVPTRLALRVPTQVDSRTILDSAGAEKLLGSGDMLYSDGDGQPKRLQSAFISETEVKNVVKYLADSYRDELGDTIELEGGISADKTIFESSFEDTSGDNGDDLYEDARQIVIETQKASTSFLQRKLGVGYARAARLIDMLEERGVVGAGNGSKPRDVLEKGMNEERMTTGSNNEELL